MIKVLKKTLEIDIAYSVNSFIYSLSKLPIFKDLITNAAYNSNLIKKIVGLISIILSFGTKILFKFIYFFTIFFLSSKLFPNNITNAYFHIYFFLTLIGLFINNKLLTTSKKKYFSIILFNMDATKFFRANLFWNLLTNTILNSICIFLFGNILMYPLKYSCILLIFTLFVRITGETLNILFYRKYNYIWYSNTKLYFTILITLLAYCGLAFLNIYINILQISLATSIFTITGLISLIYLFNIKDYHLIYKRLSKVTNVMDSKNEKDYLRQAMVDVNKKDKILDNKKIKGKKGYDYFNTIFFERHKEILLRSARKYALIALIVYVILIYLVATNVNYSKTISNFLNTHLGWFVIIMFFINRGAIITQAMFFNCDHAMLSYNFYREPKTILALFKKRLITVIKVNLIPSIIIALGNTILLIITSNNYNILTYVTTFIFIILLSVLFSVHYLVIYYLLQPFNKKMEVKKAGYSLVTMLTYLISYIFKDITISSTFFSILGLAITFFYIIIALAIINRFAPRTFKLN